MKKKVKTLDSHYSDSIITNLIIKKLLIF